MGYTGKQVIHPSQVPVVQRAFSPSQEQVQWASGLIQAFHQHQQSGKVVCACVCVRCVRVCVCVCVCVCHVEVGGIVCCCILTWVETHCWEGGGRGAQGFPPPPQSLKSNFFLHSSSLVPNFQPLWSPRSNLRARKYKPRGLWVNYTLCDNTLSTYLM